MQEDRVLILTNAAMVCLLAPGFAAIHAAAEEGRLDTAGAPEIPSSEIRWAVLWKVTAKNTLKHFIVHFFSDTTFLGA